MQSTAADRPEQSPLELQPSNLALALPALVVPGGSLQFVPKVLWPRDHFAFVAGCIGCGCMAVLLVLLLITVARNRAAGWQLRIDATGVTVRGQETVPWSGLAEVRLAEVSPKRPLRLVVFVPRAGVDLPAAATLFPMPWTRASARFLARRYGSPIVVSPVRMGVSADRIAAAVRQLSDVPVVLA